MQFDIYHHSSETGEYLCRAVMAAARIGQVADVRELAALEHACGADVILVEYQGNNPDLDNWIIQTAAQPEGPEIFLFVEEESPLVVWKAVKLGAREIFFRTLPVEDLQEALVRLECRQGRLGRDADAGDGRLPRASLRRCPSRGCRNQDSDLPAWVPQLAASGSH